MVTTYLDFEKPLAELETKIAELEAVAAQEGGPQINEELKKLKEKAAKQLKDTYSLAQSLAQNAGRPASGTPTFYRLYRAFVRGFSGTRG